MRLYTSNINERNRNAFIVDCGSYKKNFFAANYNDIQAFYDGSMTFDECMRRYVALLNQRYQTDPSFVDQLLQQDLVWLTDQAPDKFIRRAQTPRYMVAMWLEHRFQVRYLGDA